MVMVDLPLLRKIMDFSRAIFPRVEYAFTVVPSYVGGHNGFIVCSRNPVVMLLLFFLNSIFDYCS
jgi:spermidine synthase